jgi:transcriptional regulator with XRE-family HTH domain
MSQEQLAANAGIGITTLWALEKSYARVPMVETLCKLSNALAAALGGGVNGTGHTGGNRWTVRGNSFS